MSFRKRRSRKSKSKKKQYTESRQSDPEQRDAERKTNREIVEYDDGWDSLDEQILLDYIENVAIRDRPGEESEVTRRLSFLNVSESIDMPEVVTSDVDTVYSELPSGTLLDSSYSGSQFANRSNRKRSSKRNRKPIKKLKMLKSSGGKKAYLCINWCKESSQQTDDSQSGVVNRRSSDTSSRALTESESPLIDDIIMADSNNDEGSTDGLSMMEEDEQECNIIKDNDHGPPATSDVSTSTTSDSGCEGDDEESSVEISKMNSGNHPVGKIVRGWWDQEQSSADEICWDDEINFQRIINGSFPLLSQEGKKAVNWKMSSSGIEGEFKHPQLYGIKGCRGNKRKQPQSATISTPNDLWHRIHEFVEHDPNVELRLPMLSRPLCRTASNLAQVYHLDCIIHQKRRLPVAAPLLRKTTSTQLANKTEVDTILKNYQRELQTSPILWLRKNQRAQPRLLQVRVPVSALCSKVESVRTVGDDAPPIGECNIGNQMLRNMGWTPGNGLGCDGSGMLDPITVNKLPKNVGLGYLQ